MNITSEIKNILFLGIYVFSFPVTALANEISCSSWLEGQFWSDTTVEKLNACIADGASVIDRSYMYGRTPLHLAAENTFDLDVIHALINLGANPNSRDNDGQTALFFAAKNENLEIFEYFLSLQSDLNIVDLDARTLLHAAASNPNDAAVRKLLELGASVDARDHEGNTPLHISVSYKNALITDALLAAGADPNSRNRIGIAPLHWAVTQENLEHAQYLVDAGADIQLRTERGETPLHFAARNAKNPSVIEWLIVLGADPNGRSLNLNTPLHYAAESDWRFKSWSGLSDEEALGITANIIEILLDNGADAATQGRGLFTPADLARENLFLNNTPIFWRLHDESF